MKSTEIIHEIIDTRDELNNKQLMKKLNSLRMQVLKESGSTISNAMRLIKLMYTNNTQYYETHEID